MQEKTESPDQGGAEPAHTDQFNALARNSLRLFDQGTKAFTKLAERSSANGRVVTVWPRRWARRRSRSARSRVRWPSPANLPRRRTSCSRSTPSFGAPRFAAISAKRKLSRSSSPSPPTTASRIRSGRTPNFRFLDASLSSHDALGGGSTAPDRRSRRAHATKGGVLLSAALERALTLELRDDQPRSGARDPCHERQEPRAGHECTSSKTWRSPAIS